jgi:hypothetical protein
MMYFAGPYAGAAEKDKAKKNHRNRFGMVAHAKHASFTSRSIMMAAAFFHALSGAMMETAKI